MSKMFSCMVTYMRRYLCRNRPGTLLKGSTIRSVCLLKKSIYGLKQSPRAWFDKFSSLLLQASFNRTVSDYSLFVKSSFWGLELLIVYVEDIVISGSDATGINETKWWLHSQLHIKDLGELQYFSRIVVSRNKHGLLSSQEKYVRDLLSETDCGT